MGVREIHHLTALSLGGPTVKWNGWEVEPQHVQIGARKFCRDGQEQGSSGPAL